MGSDRDIVFVSYSHSMPEWRDRLLTFLKPWVRSGQLRVWADTYIKVGDRWRREIDEALGRARVGVLLIGQDFLASDFVVEEEIPRLVEAADRGVTTLVCVPVTASVLGGDEVDPLLLEARLLEFQWPMPPDRPLAALTEAERDQALVHVAEAVVAAARLATPQVRKDGGEREWSRSVDALVPGDAGGPLGGLFGIPEQRPNYVERPDDLGRVKRGLVVDVHGTVGITGSKPRVGLQGRGGMGKSVLAIAVVNDLEVRQCFPGGVYWVTLGQEPALTSLQAVLARQLGEENPVITNPHDGREQLRGLWGDRTGLLVLDDLWAAEHAGAFEITNSGSRMLVTTRDGTLLTALGAHEEKIDALSPELALRLLANWVNGEPGRLPGVAADVARECGFLPLALSVAGAMVRDGSRWDDLLLALREGKVRFLDHPSGNVFASMRLSVDFLPAADRARYLELVVFPEDVTIPEPTVCRLWQGTAGLAGYECRRLLSDFAHKGLLYLENGSGAGRVSFHDLQHDFLRLVAEEVPSIHERLVDAYLPVEGS